MEARLSIDRRTLLRAGAVATGMLMTGVGAPSLAMAAPRSSGSHSTARLAAIARKLLAAHADRIAQRDMVALADFSLPSWTPRFHIVDMRSGDVSTMLTAHGRGSDPAHSGWLKSFSNAPGSKATSKGAYLTGGRYEGKYGTAMRLAGLDPDNSNAERRAIVIHQAWYVSEAMIAKFGKLGRSEGCFALAAEGLRETLAALGPGRLLYAGRLDEIAA